MENKELLKRLVEVVQLFEQFNKNHFEDIYDGLSINEVHCIEFIEKNNKPNITTISNYLNITRGGSTKITKRLIEKEYIDDYKLEENKKEKYFRLTEKGYKIFEKHESIHNNSIERDSKLFELFNENEKDTINKFLNVLKNDLSNK